MLNTARDSSATEQKASNEAKVNPVESRTSNDFWSIKINWRANKAKIKMWIEFQVSSFNSTLLNPRRRLTNKKRAMKPTKPNQAKYNGQLETQTETETETQTWKIFIVKHTYAETTISTQVI